MRPERAHKMVAKIWKTPARSIVSVYFEQLLTNCPTALDFRARPVRLPGSIAGCLTRHMVEHAPKGTQGGSDKNMIWQKQCSFSAGMPGKRPGLSRSVLRQDPDKGKMAAMAPRRRAGFTLQPGVTHGGGKAFFQQACTTAPPRRPPRRPATQHACSSPKGLTTPRHRHDTGQEKRKHNKKNGENVTNYRKFEYLCS